ncbi:MAG: BadF/BadG/BcrA/BcrD ATPase family protein, partial [Holdemania filiformis]
MDASGFVRSLPPLFADEDEYRRFSERHQRNQVRVHEPKEITGRCALGIDAGSTTVKMVLINEQEEILYSMYQPNQGNALQLVREALIELMRANPRMEIVSSCVTGYGEDLIRSAFGVDAGIVETMAHFTASRKYMPDVDFIIDIGGQDIK